jgi:hypothetical protein
VPTLLWLLHPDFPDNEITKTQWRNWQTWQVSVDRIEQETGLNFFSELPDDIEQILESTVIHVPDIFPQSSLLAQSEIEDTLPFTVFVDNNTVVQNNRNYSPIKINTTNIFSLGEIDVIGTEERSSSNISSEQVSTSHISQTELGTTQTSLSQVRIAQISVGKVAASQIGTNQASITQVGIGQVGFSQFSTSQNGFTQIGIEQNHHLEVGFSKIGSTKINTTQINSEVGIPILGNIINTGIKIGIETRDVNPAEIQVTKVSLPSSISSSQFFSSHPNTPNLLTNIYSTAQSLWHTTTPINLNFEITNLPTGQLAEATITGYDQLGRPNTATISIDDDANGVGWFIDTTPGDSSEFTGTDNYFQATPNSAASGKYDLLTAILHEMGHALGFINGYSQFNQNIKGRQFYTDSTHSYTLSADLSHLDNTLYPNDLLNTNLKPGIRKLPSTMDWAIINAINSGVGGRVSGVGTVNPAHLTAGALIGITNGDFTTSTTWNTEGATNIINGTATLTEQSQKLSELTQAFIIPTGAKTLQFTITDNHLITGDTTKTANDAFEPTFRTSIFTTKPNERNYILNGYIIVNSRKMNTKIL